MLGQDAVFKDTDLDSVVALADDHLAVHGLAAGQELGLGDDGTAAAGVAGFAAALLLGFQAGGALDGCDAVVHRRLGHGTRRTDAGHRVGRIVAFPAGQLEVLVSTATAAAAAGGHTVFKDQLGAFVALFFGAFRLGVGLGRGAGAAAPAAAAAPTAVAGVLVLVAFLVLGLSCCGGNGDRTHHSAQVRGLEDDGSEGTRFHEQRRGRAFLGPSFRLFGLGCGGFRGGCFRSGGFFGREYCRGCFFGLRGGLGTAGAAADRLLCNRLCGRLCGFCGGSCVSASCCGGLSRGRCAGFGIAGEGRQRFRGCYSFPGPGAPRGRLGRSLGCSSFRYSSFGFNSFRSGCFDVGRLTAAPDGLI
ncbi:hypothetical protein SRABI128_05985 [Microbacterium sp. Bi128]|nr:hypothetical protein SRABI128_05985 [Microbacterium sp. Bi128]